MYEKDFENWNKYKIKTNKLPKRPMFKERDVWWCSFGVNVGDEQDGKGSKFLRPVLILKKFNENISWAVPFSTQIKDNIYYHKFTFKGVEQCAVLSQLKLIDAKRFADKMGEVSIDDFKEIREKIRNLVP
jgi:mRNA interferase MazF